MLAQLSGPLLALLWTRRSPALTNTEGAFISLCCTHLSPTAPPDSSRGGKSMAVKWSLSGSGIDLLSTYTKRLRTVVPRFLSTEPYVLPQISVSSTGY